MRMPLEDVKVLDLSHALAGPFCSTMLADFGAEVIKLEPKGAGDIARAWGPPLPGGETVVLREPAPQQEGHRGRPEAPARARSSSSSSSSGATSCSRTTASAPSPGSASATRRPRERNPGIIYCSVSGFGQDGPYRDRAALDLILQAESGMISVTGEAGGHGVRCGVSIADMTAGMYAAFGIMLALRVKERTGRGQAIDVSMLEGQLSLLGSMIGGFLADGELPGAHGHRLQGAAAVPDLPHQDPRPRPGRRQREALEGLLPGHRPAGAGGRPALSHQRRPGAEPRHAHPALQEVFLTRTYEEWEPLLLAQGIPMGAINSIAQVVEHPQVQARGTLVEMDHPRAGKVRMVGRAGAALRDAGLGAARRRRCWASTPTRCWASCWASAQSEIAALRAAGVIGPNR